MNSELPTAPLVCDMNVFTPAERELYIQTTTKLFQSLQNIQAIENGFTFSFPNQAEFITSLAEFISKECLCCPFLDFTLRIQPNQQFISLTLTGPEGTQEFLREEFNEVFE